MMSSTRFLPIALQTKTDFKVSTYLCIHCGLLQIRIECGRVKPGNGIPIIFPLGS